MSKPNPEFLSNQSSAMMEELSGVNHYISISSKNRIVAIINKMEREIRKANKGVKEIIKRAENLKSIIMSLPSTLTNINHTKMLYNRLNDFMITLRWHVLNAVGKDVGEEPWTMEEDVKESESSRKKDDVPQLPPGVQAF